MAFVWGTGFEHGMTPITTGGGLAATVTASPSAPTAITSSPASGTYCMKFANSATSQSTMQTPTLTGDAVFVVRAKIKFVTLNTAITRTIVTHQSTTANRAGVGYDASGNFAFIWWDGSAATVAATGPAITLNQWYLVEFWVKQDANPWTAAWRIDGMDQTSPGSAAYSAHNPIRLLIGCLPVAGTTNYTSEVHFDDILLRAEASVTGYPIGTGTTLQAPLSTTASHQSITTTEWQTTSDFSSFSDFTGQTETTSAPLLNTMPLTSVTRTGIRINVAAGAAAGNARWALTTPSGAPTSIDPVFVSALVAMNDTGGNDCTFRTELSGSTTTIVTGDLAGNPGVFGAFMATAPGSVAWTISNLTTTNFEGDAADANPAIELEGVCYEVFYGPLLPPELIVQPSGILRAK